MTGAVIAIKGIQQSSTLGNFRINFQVSAQIGSKNVTLDWFCESAYPGQLTNYTIETDLINASRAALANAGDTSAASRAIFILGGEKCLNRGS